MSPILNIRPKDRDAIFQSLREGVVPRAGLQYIQVGRKNEIEALVKDLNRIKDGGAGMRLVVGEYGSGKTTVGRAVVGLLPVTAGSLRIAGNELADIAPRKLRELRRNVSIVFQDPGSSLNPRLPVGQSIGEPLLLRKLARGAELHLRVEDLLDQVHLERSMRNRYPH